MYNKKGRKKDGTDEYDYERGQYVDRWNWKQVPLHTEDQNSITILSKYKPRFRSSETDRKIHYNAAILPRWEAFSQSVGERKCLEGFQIDNIVLPPSTFLETTLLPALSKNTNLLSLELSNCGLDTAGMKCVAKFLQKNKSLATLDLSGNKFEDVRATKSLSASMKKHKELSFVNLTNCNIGENAKLLSAVLDGCKGLQSLVLDDNSIGGRPAPYGAPENTEVRAEDVTLVSNFLSDNTTLTVFSMRENNIGTAAELMMKGLTDNTNLRELSLGENGFELPNLLLGSKCAMEKFIHLDLSGSELKMPGTKLIAKFLKSNPALVELNLASTGIPSKAAKLLVPALKRNTTLQHLNLSGNSFNNNSVPFFVDTLRKNTSLLTLDLCYNNINVNTGRVALLRGALCDVSSLQAIVESNHKCAVTMVGGGGSYRNHITNEKELRSINSLDITEGEKIRLKVVFALFGLAPDLFDPRSFDDVPLELMPRLLEIAQQELGFKGYGKGVVKRKSRGKTIDPTLRRIFQVFTEWHTPLLVMVSCFYFVERLLPSAHYAYTPMSTFARRGVLESYER